MNKREAKRYAAGILSLEDLGAIVGEQVGGANERLNMPITDQRRIVEAAHELEQELYQRAGSEVMEAIAGAARPTDGGKTK